MSHIPIQMLPAAAGYSTANTRGTNVQSGSAGALGSWVELVSSLPYDAMGFFVSTINANSEQHKLEIGVGGSGSEVSLGELTVSLDGTYINHFVPIPIAAGTRVVARCQAGNVSGAATHIVPVRGKSDDPKVSRGVLLNWSDANGLGAVDPGATANTKGSWTEMTASTSRDVSAITLFFDIKGNAGGRWGVDVGIGGSGSEQTIIENLGVTSEAFRSAARPSTIGPIWTPIPAASRIAVRVQSSDNTATQRNLGVAIVLWE